MLSETVLGARLLRRLDAAEANPSAESLGALRAALTDLVDRMRALDLSLERVVAAVETLLREHGVPARVLTLDEAPEAPTLAARLLEWSVRAYRDDDWW